MTPGKVFQNRTSFEPPAPNSNGNVKTISHVEINQTKGNGASSSTHNDAVEHIVNSAELREAAARESSRAYGENIHRSTLEAMIYGGPFTSTELSQLSLLCTTTVGNGNASSSSPGNGGKFSPEFYGSAIKSSGDWASLDGDLLASLTPMLQTHVASAVGIDLVGEGRDVIVKSMEAETNPEKNTGPVITIHQVSLECIVCYW